MSVTEQTRSVVWNGLFDVARAARHYDGAVKKYAFRRYTDVPEIQPYEAPGE